MLVVRFNLSNRLILRAENVPKVIVLYRLSWQYCLPLRAERNFFRQLNGVSEPRCYKQMNVNLKGLVKHHVFVVPTASNYKAVFLLLIFGIIIKQNGRRINFSLPKIGFLDKDKCLILDLIDHAFKKVFFLLFLVSEDENVIFAFVLNVFNFDDNEFFL